MKKLIILSGIPASGKSTWSKNFLESHPNTLIVSSDAIRLEVTGQYNDFTRQKEVWETFDKRIKEYSHIDNATVILDALNDLNVLRRKYVKDNPEYDKYVLVLFPLNLESSLHYNSLRTEGRVPDKALIELAQKFEEPDEETLSLFDEVIKVG